MLTSTSLFAYISGAVPHLAGVVFSLRLAITVEGGNGVGVDLLDISCVNITNVFRMLINRDVINTVYRLSTMTDRVLIVWLPFRRVCMFSTLCVDLDIFLKNN